MINGIININKDEGFTSHDVVAKLRGILHFKHIGHTGTLDPLATGVLPVCIGSATKLCDMETAKTKEYIATILFGTSTDSEDITGNVLQTLPVFSNEQDLVGAFSLFTGDIMQLPPMYSAIKVQGKKLYEIAREGKSVDVPKRPVHIERIELLTSLTDSNGYLQEAQIKVTCGKGTYIRSLCRDLGEALHTCACMKTLVRTQTGRFTLDKSFTLKEVQELAEQGRINEAILPIDVYFDEYEKLQSLPEFDYLLHNGNPLRKREIIKPESFTDKFRAYDSQGKFCGIYYFDGATGKYKPFKMFLEM